MSLSHETILELMSLADGELEGADKERVERLVADSDEARQVVESLRGAEVGAWLSSAMDEKAVRGGADRIADEVMAAIAQPSAGGAVASLADRRSRAPRGGQRSRVPLAGAGVVAVLAVAAAAILYVDARAPQPGERAPVASVGTPHVDFQVPSAVAQANGPQPGAPAGVEVNEIDAPSRGVSVFEIPGAAAAAVAAVAGPSSVVVWVEEDQTEPEKVDTEPK
jgi:hypothetical protein